MKELFGKGITKSIISGLILSLALCAVLIGVHTTLGVKATKPLINNAVACENDKEKCAWNEVDWEELDKDATWGDYDKLIENFPKGHEAISIYTNKVSNMSSIVWFNFYRNMVVAFAMIGIVGGAILDLVYKKKSKKKK